MPPLPPLVLPRLAPSEVAAPSPRYSRSARLDGIGLDGQTRLAAARVLVVGAGGLGSPVVQYLALSGVGTLGIVDDDVVDLSNLQRQVLYRTDQVGLPKARAAADWVRAANPEVAVRAHPVRLSAATAALLDDYDLVVDGSDSFETCYVVADAAADRGLPVVWGSVSRFDGQTSVFWDSAPDGRAIDYRDLHPEAPAGGWDESCADVGVLGPLCGTVASVMASEAVKLITGTGEPLLGRVVTIDASTATWRESRLVRAPGRSSRVSVRKAPAVRQAPATRQAAAVAAPPVATIGADALEARLVDRARGLDDFTLLDVRETHEIEAGVIPGAIAAPGYGSTSTAHPSLDRAKPVVVYCARGPRSKAAGRLLAAEGYDVVDLERGMLGWTLRPSALAQGDATGSARIPLPLGDIDPAAFHPNRHP